MPTTTLYNVYNANGNIEGFCEPLSEAVATLLNRDGWNYDFIKGSFRDSGGCKHTYWYVERTFNGLTDHSEIWNFEYHCGSERDLELEIISQPNAGAKAYEVGTEWWVQEDPEAAANLRHQLECHADWMIRDAEVDLESAEKKFIKTRNDVDSASVNVFKKRLSREKKKALEILVLAKIITLCADSSY